MSTPKSANDNNNSLPIVSSPKNSSFSDTGNDCVRVDQITAIPNSAMNTETVQTPEDLNDFVADLLEQMVRCHVHMSTFQPTSADS